MSSSMISFLVPGSVIGHFANMFCSWRRLEQHQGQAGVLAQVETEPRSGNCMGTGVQDEIWRGCLENKLSTEY